MAKISFLELLTLAALWGASFICMRIASPEFGVISLIFLRVIIAALILSPFAMKSSVLLEIKAHIRPIFSLGLFMTAIPFTLFAFASLSLSAGTMVVINATSPIWAVLISSKMNRYCATKGQFLGMGIGLLGVILIAWGSLFHDFNPKIGLSIMAAVGATICYGLGTSISRRYLNSVSPIGITFGSLSLASLTLIIPASMSMPYSMPSSRAWVALVILGSCSTGFAYLLFYHLIKTIGGERAITVTYLQPLFGIAWGIMLLDEPFSIGIILSGTIILLGTALVTKALPLGK